MPRYAYAGQGPVPDGQGGVIRPGEERDGADLPDHGPWDLLPEPEPVPEPVPEVTPPPVPTTPPPAPPRASTPPAAAEGK